MTPPAAYEVHTGRHSQRLEGAATPESGVLSVPVSRQASGDVDWLQIKPARTHTVQKEERQSGRHRASHLKGGWAVAEFILKQVIWGVLKMIWALICFMFENDPWSDS